MTDPRLELRKALGQPGQQFTLLEAIDRGPHVWNALGRAQRKPATRIALGTKSKGAIDADPVKYLANISALPDVIDIDAKTFPWCIFAAIFARKAAPAKPLTIFTTYARLQGLGHREHRDALALAGVQFETDLPAELLESLPDIETALLYYRLPAARWRVTRAVRIVDAERFGPLALYCCYGGLQLEPK